MNKILTNIAHGWCEFNLGDYHGRPSYVRFLPLDILDAYEEYEKRRHCIIEFDCETYQFCLVIWENNLIILDNRYGRNNSIFTDIDARQVLEQLVSEIINDTRTWAEWISTTGIEENIEQAEKMIIKRICDVGIHII